MTDMKFELIAEGFTPEYADDGDAGMDCRARLDEELIVFPGQAELVPLGFKIEIPNNQIGGFLFPKSGRGHKEGLILGNCIGVIDSGYRGEVMASIWNRNSNEALRIKPGQKVCQIVFLPIIRADLYHGAVGHTTRGEGGFGSTGIS